MRLPGHVFHELIVEADSRADTARVRQKAIVKSPPATEPSAPEIKGQPWHKNEIECIFGGSVCLGRLRNAEPPGGEIPTARDPMEDQVFPGNTRQGDPLILRPGIEHIRFPGNGGKRENRA